MCWLRQPFVESSWVVSFLLVAARSTLAVVRAMFDLVRSLIDSDRASMVLLFTVAANARVSNDSPNFSTISSRILSSMLSFLTVEFAFKPDLLVVSLIISDTFLSAAQKYFSAFFQLRSVRLFFFHVVYVVLIVPVDPTWVYSCRTMSALLIGTSPSATNFWQSSCFLK